MMEFDKTKKPEEEWDYIKMKMFKGGPPQEMDNLVKNQIKSMKTESDKWAILASVMLMVREKVYGDSKDIINRILGNK